jgi:hypothetical protein
LTQRSHRKGDQQQYIIPKEEKVVVGVKEKELEHAGADGYAATTPTATAKAHRLMAACTYALSEKYVR